MNEINITNLFKQRGFRTTPQRIAVFKYLCENPTHPDADEIYKSVIGIHPSFSKTTVYNSLQSLVENGFIIKINIDGTRVRYDANTSLHGHFICNCCGKIFDFDVSDVQCSGLDDFSVATRDVYFSGLCNKCK